MGEHHIHRTPIQLLQDLVHLFVGHLLLGEPEALRLPCLGFLIQAPLLVHAVRAAQGNELDVIPDPGEPSAGVPDVLAYQQETFSILKLRRLVIVLQEQGRLVMVAVEEVDRDVLQVRVDVDAVQEVPALAGVLPVAEVAQHEDAITSL